MPSSTASPGAATQPGRTVMRKIAFSALGVTGALFVLFSILVAWPEPSAPLPETAPGFVVRNVRVVDVANGTTSPPMTVVIARGRIIAMKVGFTDPAGYRHIDGTGRFLAPAFWDMHAHSFQHSPQVEFPLWVANGVLNLRDMMDCPGERDSLIACAADKRRWNARIAKGKMSAPRIVATSSYYLENPDLTPAEVSTLAATYQRRGLDALKVYNRLSRQSYFRAADEARKRGIRLIGHLPKAIALPEAITAGQASFEHGHVLARHCFRRAAAWREGRLDGMAPMELLEALIREHDPAACASAYARMRAAGAWLVPTHVTREEDARAADPSFIDDPRLSYLDPLSRWALRDDLGGTANAHPGQRGERALKAYFRHGLALTGAAHRAGVRVLVGTDTALGGFRYHDEMGHLASAGMSPAAVLRAATLDAARYAGLDRDSGSVAIGKRADLVLLDANPLEDISNTRRIRAVFMNGRLYDRNRLDALLGFARGQAAAPHNWAKLVWGFSRSSVASDL